MKISKIEEIDNIFHVTLTPNLIQRWFGLKENIKQYKDSGRTFMVGGGAVYIRNDGIKLDNGCKIGKALDRFQRKF